MAAASKPDAERDMRALCADFDWSRTSLGHWNSWPQSLRSMVQLTLAMLQPAMLVWGRDFSCIYNDACRALLGPRHSPVLGRSLWQLWPEFYEFHARSWSSLTAGESVWTEDCALTIERTPGVADSVWLSISSVPVSDEWGRIAGTLSTFVDTTARKSAEARHAFLFEMADRLRAIEDPVDIQCTAARLLGEYLRVNRCVYGEIDGDYIATVHGYAHEVAPFPSGKYSLTELGSALLENYRRGESVAVEDVTCDPRLTPEEAAMYGATNIRAFVVATLRKGERLVGGFALHSATPRRWTNAEIELLRDVAERIWADAERARAENALRESEARHSFLLTLSDRLRALSEPREILRAAAYMLGHHLRVATVQYSLVDQDMMTGAAVYSDGNLPDLVEGGRYALSELGGWGAALRAGHEIYSENVEADSRDLAPELLRNYKLRAGNAIPLIKDGRIVAVLGSAHHEPRRWTESEKSLMRDVAERTWAAAERARAEAALRVSEEQTRLAIGAASMFTWSIDVETDRYECSPNAPDVVGFAAPPVRPSASGAVQRLSTTEEANRYAEARARTLRGEGDLHIDHALIHPETGAEVWLETHATRLVDPSTGVVRLLGVSQNITERKRSEARSHENEARQAYLLALSDALRPLADPRAVQVAAARVLGEYVRVSRAYYTEIDEDRGVCSIRDGYLRSGVVSLAGLYPAEAYLPSLRTLRTGEASVIRDTLDLVEVPARLGAKYSKADVRAQVAVPLLKGGRVVAAFTMSQTTPRDWTPLEVSLLFETAERTWAAVERAKAEIALRESEERFRAHLDATSDVLFRMSPDWSEMRAFAGREIADMITSPRSWMDDFVSAEDQPRVRAEIDAALAEKRVFRLEHRVPGVDGHTRWVSSRAVPLFDDAGDIKEWFGAASDVTPRREAEEAAERTSRAKDEFLATLSHELRTPLAAIALWAGALRSGAVRPHEVGRAVDAIAQSAESQSRLIEDLLDLSRLTAGKLMLAPSPIDPGVVARSAIDVVRPMAEAKRIALDVDIERKLGPAMFDGARLKQVLWNLLSNAIKFTPEGGSVTLRVRKLVSVANPARVAQLELIVSDTGEGITADFLPHVFERFRQADMGDTRSHAGLGIGLALTRQLVELQGGTIDVQSDGRGQGATFCARIPWLDSDGSAAPIDDEETPEEGLSGPLAGLNVLVVEDDGNTREAMQWILVRAGARVVSVGSATEALRVFGLNGSGERLERWEPASPQPDIIVSDLGLPGMSGYELIEQIAAACQARGLRVPPACAVSAHAREIDRQRAIEAGFDLHMGKPVTPEKLIEAVQDLRDIAASA